MSFVKGTIKMEKEINNKIDFANLGFGYHKTAFSYLSYWKNGIWDLGDLVESDQITISATSTALHYGQQCFEGLKAYRWIDGSIHLFRPEENAKRLQESCRRLIIPEIPVEKFLDGVTKVVKANERFVPPYGTMATLYIRPYVIGIGDNLGLKPASTYLFGIIVSPVGPLFKGALKPVHFMVSDYDRAAPRGTGAVKVGGNYAASLYPGFIAKSQGFEDCIYLDPATHTKIEEVGTANFFGITQDNVFVTPTSPSILPSITKRSLLYLAKEYLHLKVEERDVYIDNLSEFKEVGACGTAAVITPIGGIKYGSNFYIFGDGNEVGIITKRLYDTLTKIQFGDLKAPDGWIYDVT